MAKLNPVARRACGDDLTLPILTFGSMRFDPNRLDVSAGRDLLEYLFDHGVDAIHSSRDYKFHHFFCAVLRSLGRRDWIHMIKLGEPNGDYTDFHPDRVIEIVEEQLKALNAPRIDIVQWFFRAPSLEDEQRLALFEEFREQLEDTANTLIGAGKIGMMTVFPYTLNFAQAVLPHSWCRGLLTYLNPAEREYVQLLDDMQENGKFLVAIRPFFAGKLVHPNTIEGSRYNTACQKMGIAANRRLAFALRFPLLHPAVSSVMLSMTTRAHAESAISILQNVDPDLEVFASANAAFKDEWL